MRRYVKTQRNKGFTIVELLIVIVVIVILSLVVVALYDGVATNARDVSVKSDLKNAQDELELDHLHTGKYPALAADVNNGVGFTVSEGNSLTYATKPYGYCVTGSNPDASTSFMIRSIDKRGTIQAGNCDPTVTTYAGNPNQGGYVDGAATSARFIGAWGAAMDKDGNLFVSEGVGHRIRKITADGSTVTTYAGTGVSGTTDGPCSTATFNGAKTMVFDQTGTLVVADTDGRYIRKISSDCTVTTLVNSATGAKAWFNRISGLAVDEANNLYVFEAYAGGKIWKVTPGGIITLLAGSGTVGFADGTGAAAQFQNWCSMTMGSDGAIYVADNVNHRIRRVTLDGVVTTVAGTGTAGEVDGPLGTGQITDPIGITSDANGNLYIIEGNDGSPSSGRGLVVRVIAPDGTVSTPKSQDGTALDVGYQGWWGSGYDWAYNSITMGNDGSLYIVSPYAVNKVVL